MQAMRIERARYIARTMDGTVEIRSHLVLTDDEIDTLVFRQRGSDAVAAATLTSSPVSATPLSDVM